MINQKSFNLPTTSNLIKISPILFLSNIYCDHFLYRSVLFLLFSRFAIPQLTTLETTKLNMTKRGRPFIDESPETHNKRRAELNRTRQRKHRAENVERKLTQKQLSQRASVLAVLPTDDEPPITNPALNLRVDETIIRPDNNIDEEIVAAQLDPNQFSNNPEIPFYNDLDVYPSDQDDFSLPESRQQSPNLPNDTASSPLLPLSSPNILRASQQPPTTWRTQPDISDEPQSQISDYIPSQNFRQPNPNHDTNCASDFHNSDNELPDVNDLIGARDIRTVLPRTTPYSISNTATRRYPISSPKYSNSPHTKPTIPIQIERTTDSRFQILTPPSKQSESEEVSPFIPNSEQSESEEVSPFIPKSEQSESEEVSPFIPKSEQSEPEEVSPFIPNSGQSELKQGNPRSVVEEFHASSVDDRAEEQEDSQEEENVVDECESTAAKLFDYIVDFPGCTARQHLDISTAHNTNHNGKHYGLNVIGSMSIPSALANERFLKNQRPAQNVIDGACFNKRYCGYGPRETTPRSLCLHAEKSLPQTPSTTFDVDSFIGFASSLAFALKGLHYSPTPRFDQNIKTDLHLTTRATFTLEDGTVVQQDQQIKDTPHIYFGQVAGARHINIYILFPKLSTKSSHFQALTAKQLERWSDKILRPAIDSQCPSDVLQHYPASYNHAETAATAKYLETRSAPTSTLGIRTGIHHFLAPQYLVNVWQQICDITATTDGLKDFGDPLLFFSAKGLKLQYKRPTAGDCIRYFKSDLDTHIDRAYIFRHNFFVDFAKETCPPGHSGSADPVCAGSEPQVLLWRRCCLETSVSKLYGKERRGLHQYYNVAMMRDACNLTSVPNKGDPLRKGGLLYTQLYSSYKELGDAAKVYPFANENLEILAVDPAVRDTAARVARSNAPDEQILRNAYTASKKRLHEGLSASSKKSFGVRQEHRVSWPLFEQLNLRFEAQAQPAEAVDVTQPPLHVWVITTESFIRYLWQNVNKFAAAFEMVEAANPDRYISWDRTLLMAAFLRCLRFAFAAHNFKRESALWSERRRAKPSDPNSAMVCGLGFARTLNEHGYCWIQPIIDWKQQSFKTSCRKEILFGSKLLQARYHKNHDVIKDWRDDNIQLDECDHWMRRFRSPEARESIILHAIHICLRNFRVDVLTAFARHDQSIKRHDIERMYQGEISLCHTHLTELLGKEPRMYASNRSNMKDFQTLFDTFFGETTPSTRRLHGRALPYRTAYNKARNLFTTHSKDPSPEAAWRKVFAKELITYNWMFPVPDLTNGVLCIKQHGLSPAWWSVMFTGAPTSIKDVFNPGKVRFGKKSFHPGSPRPFPERYLTWSEEQWETYLENKQRRSGNPAPPATASAYGGPAMEGHHDTFQEEEMVA